MNTSPQPFENLDGPGGELDRFLGKRSPKGLVIRQLRRGEKIAQWFVRVSEDGEILAAPLRMPFDGSPFQPCASDREAQKVLFFARRGLN